MGGWGMEGQASGAFDFGNAGAERGGAFACLLESCGLIQRLRDVRAALVVGGGGVEDTCVTKFGVLQWRDVRLDAVESLGGSLRE